MGHDRDLELVQDRLRVDGRGRRLHDDARRGPATGRYSERLGGVQSGAASPSMGERSGSVAGDAADRSASGVHADLGWRFERGVRHELAVLVHVAVAVPQRAVHAADRNRLVAGRLEDGTGRQDHPWRQRGRRRPQRRHVAVSHPRGWPAPCHRPGLRLARRRPNLDGDRHPRRRLGSVTVVRSAAAHPPTQPHHGPRERQWHQRRVHESQHLWPVHDVASGSGCDRGADRFEHGAGHVQSES